MRISEILKWISLFLLGFILQTTLVPAISIFGIKPDLMVLVLFMLAIKTGVMPALYIGFLLGLGQDLYSGSILGQNALAKTIAGSFAGLFNVKVMRIDPISQAILLMLVFLLNDAVFTTVQVIKLNGSLKILGNELVTSTLPRALYTLILGVVPIVWGHYFQAAIKR